MNPSAFHSSDGPPCKRGFTLVELLVSMAVLVLLVVLVTQLTNGAASTIRSSGKHMDSDTQARLIFGRMSEDFSKMLKRPDVDYSTFKSATPGMLPSPPYSPNIAVNTQTQSGNDQLAFYAETTGYYSGAGTAPGGAKKAATSLVAYNTAADPYTLAGKVNVLRRMGKTLGWEPNSGSWQNVAYLPILLTAQWPALFSTTPQDPDYQTIGNMVFRMEYTYLLKPNYASGGNQPARLSITPWDTTAIPPHTSVNGFQDVSAIVVAIAVMDSNSRTIVSTSGYKGMGDQLHDAQEGVDVASDWIASVNSPDFAANAGIPKAAASAVRIYQRYFYLGL